MANLSLLLEGYQRFYKKYFLYDNSLYNQFSKKGQAPKTLVIGCSDSRVDPSILTDTEPGDIFVIRNVANLVPPYQPLGDSYHGTSAALEFASNHLLVDNIIVLGHSECAGINALMDSTNTQSNSFSFISSWVDIAIKAKEHTLSVCNHDDKNKYAICEKESIIISIQNLLTFPWIKSKVEKKTITIHGWYFSLSDGKLYTLSDHKTWLPVT